MSITLSVNKKTKESAVKLNPQITPQNAKEHMQVFLDTFPQLLMDLVSNLYPMLRPVTEEEKDAHIYVFLDGERGEQENQIYRAKKHCYDILTQLFSSTLTALFPDVEYIIQCANYQQEYMFTHSEEECDAYQRDVELVTKYVRDNIADIIKKFVEEAMDESANMDQESKEAKEE